MHTRAHKHTYIYIYIYINKYIKTHEHTHMYVNTHNTHVFFEENFLLASSQISLCYHSDTTLKHSRSVMLYIIEEISGSLN